MKKYFYGKPKKPGYYWCRENEEDEPFIIYSKGLDPNEDKPITVIGNCMTFTFKELKGHQLYGPIEKP